MNGHSPQNGPQETDVVVVGAGLSGLATALGASVKGLRVTVLEASDLVGGAASFSGGQVWIGANHVAERLGLEDDPQLVEQYLRAIAHRYPEHLDEQAMHRWIETAPQAAKYWEDLGAIAWDVIPDFPDAYPDAAGARPAGRYLTNQVIDGSAVGALREHLRVSPYFPMGTTYGDMMSKGRRTAGLEDKEHVAQHAGNPAFGTTEQSVNQRASGEGDALTFGTGVVASFLARVVQEENITILRNQRVEELLTDDSGRVVGVRSGTTDGTGQPVTTEYRGTVVLATSSYDWDPELVREFLGLEEDDFGSVAPHSLRGDGVHLARQVGGAVRRLPANCVPMIPGWRSDTNMGFSYGPEYALPHSMMVDARGQRFCDDSYWGDIVAKGLDPDDRHLPFFLVWDEQHHRKYGLGDCPPGGEYPEGVVTSADTLEELGAALGIDPAGLAATAARFSEGARRGEDPDFGRGTNGYARSLSGDPSNEPNPLLGPIEEGPFHGLRLRFIGTGIGSSGVAIDSDGRVLDESGSTIPGLYAVGSCAATTTFGTGYNSGFALGRGITLAYLVSHELAGQPL